MKPYKRILFYVLAAMMLLNIYPAGGLISQVYGKYILLDENFNSYETGEQTVAYTEFRTAVNGIGSTFEIADFPSSSNKSLKVTINNVGAGTSSVANLYLQQIPNFKMLTFEISIYATSMNGGFKIGPRQPVTSKWPALATITKEGFVIPVQGDSEAREFAQPYDTNTWLKLRFVMNLQTSKYDFYFNDRPVASNLDMPLGEDAWKDGFSDVIIQRSGTNINSVWYFDDVRFYSGTPDSMLEPPVIEEDNGGLNLWFSPRDKVTTLQDPPFFRWTAITLGESYDLQLSRDKDMAVIEKEIKDIPYNYYSLPETLGPGIWYWRVRGRSVNGQSDWSKIRRFRISKDATPFVVPETDELVRRVRKDHPRIWTNNDELAEFRALADGPSKDFYQAIKKRVDDNLNNPIPDEPKFSPPQGSKPGDPEYVTAQGNLRTYSDGKVNEMFEAAFLYLVTGDKKYGEKSVAFMESIAKWDIYGDTSYQVQDQVHRAIAYKTAIAYDWVYDLLNSKQKEAVRAMVKERTEIMYNLLLRGFPLYILPFDSHGWSAAGFMGIISLAMMDEIPEAEEWFRNIYPAYINIYPVWGGEDGGFANGTAYWSYGSSPFTAVALDALYSATGFQTYERTAARNEYLFPLYMTPNGAPTGAFGDEGNIVSWRDSTCVTYYLSAAHIFKNPVAKWGAQTRGVKPYDGEISYYAHFEDEVPAIPPLDYPTGRIFRDIGWAGMHTDLVDPQRVSFLFKSSPYGSYNHSHADQNSFIINAYGEPLAIDSGWYDYYYSAHDKGYTKRTHAHNAITYNGLLGQYLNPLNGEENILAKGKMGSFVTGNVFDGVTGDATRAYAGNLGKTVRSAVFLKNAPAIVMVDELKAKEGEQTSFAYNLHARSPIETDASKNQVVIRQGKAELVATMAYPENVTIESFDKYITAETREEVPPGSRLTGKPNQYFINFNTEKVEETVMVSILDIHKKEEGQKEIQVEKNEECMKITIGGDQTVYVRLKQEGAVSYGDVTFDGTFCAFGNNTFLLQNGTSLIKDGIVLAKTEKLSSVLYEEGRLHLSAVEDNTLDMTLGYRAQGDSNELRLGLPVSVSSIADEKGFVMQPENSPEYDVKTMPLKWAASGEKLHIAFENGDYNLYLNGTPVIKPTELSIRVEGTPLCLESPPVMINGTVLAPALLFGESLGAQAADSGNKVLLTKGDTAIEISEGSSSVLVNGTEVQMAETAQRISGVLYVPVRPVCDGFSARIGWHETTQTVYIYTSPIYESTFDSSVWPR